ncbi:ATP-binding protein [Nocardioides marmoraquaticus]
MSTVRHPGRELEEQPAAEPSAPSLLPTPRAVDDEPTGDPGTVTVAGLTGTPRVPVLLLLVLAMPLTAMPVVVGNGTDAWWPVNAVGVALVMTAPHGWRLAAAAAGTVALALAVAPAYDVGPLLATSAALTATLPAWVTYLLLDRLARAGPGGREPFTGLRYHAVLVGSALFNGLLVVGVVGSREGSTAALQGFVVTSVGSLAGLVVVLPAFYPLAGRPRTGSRWELWAQRVALVLTVPASGVLGAAIVVAFPLLCWAGLRASRRETHVQTVLFALLVYVASVAGTGPLAPAVQGDVLPGRLAVLPLYVFLAALAYLVVPLASSVERLSQLRLEAQRTASTLERSIAAAHTTIFIITDDRGRITHFNDGAVTASGYPAEEALGRGGAFLVPQHEVDRKADELGVPADFESVRQALLDLEVRTDWELRTRDGGSRTVSLSLNRIFDASGAVVGCLACGDDVTDRIRSQRALETALRHEQRSVQKLQEVDDVKQELISTVSHELRTPITSIAGYAELLADNSLGDLTRQQRDALQRIERNAVRLQTLVDDLLTLSRSESGRLQLSRVPLDLRHVVRSAWELFEAQLTQRRLATSLVLPPEPVMVVGDHDALERVVVNLVSNAVKFTPDGGAVTVALTSDTGTARLLVRDSGIGIDPGDQEKLFTRFFRAREATDQAIQGTGLGLSIVQALVTQHGGHVAVRSQPGTGTRVTVDLPTG